MCIVCRLKKMWIKCNIIGKDMGDKAGKKRKGFK